MSRAGESGEVREYPFGDPAETPDPVVAHCVHCGHAELPHHQCTNCGGIPTDPGMPWERLPP